jgi:CMP-N-acetylneuraminic acid synthetase
MPAPTDDVQEREPEGDVKIAAIVPARAGSKRCPGKNARELAGKPLWMWTTDAAEEATTIDETWVATDHPRIASQWRGPMQWRMAEHATDEQTSAEMLRYWLDESGCRADVLVLLQPTSPFRDAADIDAVVGAMLTHDRKSAIAVDEDGKACGAVYAVDRAWFLHTGSLISGDVVTVRIKHPATLDIDTEADWARAQEIAEGMR